MISARALLYVISVMACLFFITYSGIVYFDVYTASKKVLISVQDFEVEPQASNTIVKTLLVLQNPSRLELKVIYLKQQVYEDSRLRVLLGESFLNIWPPTLDEYVVHVAPLSSGNVTIWTLLQNFLPEGSNMTLYLKVFVHVVNVPIINSFQLQQKIKVQS